MVADDGDRAIPIRAVEHGARAIRAPRAGLKIKGSHVDLSYRLIWLEPVRCCKRRMGSQSCGNLLIRFPVVHLDQRLQLPVSADPL